MPTCQFGYYSDFPRIRFDCKEDAIPNDILCIFHNPPSSFEHLDEIAKRFEKKVSDSIVESKPLECIGYYLPEIKFGELLIGKIFREPVYFNSAKFSGRADFSGVTFSERADFNGATFSGRADFSQATFSRGADFHGAIFYKGAIFTGATFSEGRTDFSEATFSGRADFSLAKFLDEAHFLWSRFEAKILFMYTLFEEPKKVAFNHSNLSKVSFAASDITRISFGDKIIWGGRDGFTIIEEERLQHKAQLKNNVEDRKEDDVEYREEDEKDEIEVSLELVLSIYRNLRENYEFRLRYDEAGKFFIKEMELKRTYREIRTEKVTKTKKNGWFRKHFSLTGLYYHFSRYGESISRPTLIGAITVSLSTLFWLTQSNPSLEPHFDPSLEAASTSAFVGFREVGNATQWLKAFERSFADFLPLLPAGDFKVGIIDYIIKIVGGALTFGLLAIALRRKFERKYTR